MNGSVGVLQDTYHYCNMPHVGSAGFATYPLPPLNMDLLYVEVVQRHHKRTPYASNTFPHEDISWSCDDVKLVSYGIPDGTEVASVYWKNYQEPLNPFSSTGFKGTCQLPQITGQGLQDSYQHGSDLRSIYVDALHFLPPDLPDTNSPVEFRVTSNAITSQVAGALFKGLYPSSATIVAFQQISSSDSLAPGYPCPGADALRSAYQGTADWTAHLSKTDTVELFKRLDAVSGVDPNNPGWHSWFDHYFDNLSSKQCHEKPLPCSPTSQSLCITQDDADKVYSMGQLEYDLLFSQADTALKYCTLRYGVFLWELIAHLRAALAGSSIIKYRHGIAHDGSIAPLIGALQVDKMVWPGMGSEVVFELWREKDGRQKAFVRVLWGGVPMKTKGPLGTLDLIPFDKFEQHIISMVGEGAKLVVQGCSS